MPASINAAFILSNVNVFEAEPEQPEAINKAYLLFICSKVLNDIHL